MAVRGRYVVWACGMGWRIMDKQRWSELKKGYEQPANAEERNALEQWRNDKAVVTVFEKSQMFIAKSTRDMREGVLCNYKRGK